MKRYYIVFLLFTTSCLVELTSSFSASSAAKPSPSLSLAKDTIQLHPDTANDVLYNLLSAKDDSTIILQGLVTKRRAIGKSLVFLDIIPMNIPDKSYDKGKKSKKNTRYDEIETITPVQAILKRDCWSKLIDENTNTTSSTYNIYHKIIQPGVHVQLLGEAGSSRNAQEAILFLNSGSITLVNDNPQHVRNILRYAAADNTKGDETLDIDEVVNALPWITKEELESLIGRDDSTTKSFYDIGVDILNRAPRNYLYNPSKLMGSTNSQKVKLLPPSPPEYIEVPSSTNAVDESQDVTTISNVLRQLNQMSDDDQYTQFTITGWVQNRRRYQGAISILELVDEFSSLAASSNDEGDNDIEGFKLKDLWKDRIYAVLHPDALDSNNNTDTTTSCIELSERYGNILCSGARVLLQGCMSSSSTTKGAPTFWVTSCTLLRSSWRLNTVRYVLDLLHEGKLDVEEASSALELQYSQGENISMGTTSATERQWLAAELTQSLQGDNSRIGKITDEMKNSLKTFAYARESYPTEQISNKPEIAVSTGPLRTNIEGSRWERAKKPQLQLMIEQIANVLRSHPEYGQRVLKVIDIGGGRGLLSNFLAEIFGDSMVTVKVIDISKSATNNGRMRARRQGIKNIKFEARDATTLPFDDVDVVVALHACGVLSDVALGHATCQGAGFVICPCCFKSNPHLRVSIPAEESSITELVTSEEWLGVDPSDYKHLKHLAELQGDIDIASKAMHTICGLRALAVSRRSAANLDISILKFPVGFSTRNLCLVGKFNKDNR